MCAVTVLFLLVTEFEVVYFLCRFAGVAVMVVAGTLRLVVVRALALGRILRSCWRLKGAEELRISPRIIDLATLATCTHIFLF